jgi:hypothetical protein
MREMSPSLTKRQGGRNVTRNEATSPTYFPRLVSITTRKPMVGSSRL